MEKQFKNLLEQIIEKGYATWLFDKKKRLSKKFFFIGKKQDSRIRIIMEMKNSEDFLI